MVAAAMDPDCDHINMINIKEHYTLVRELGRGTYGKVCLAVCHKTNAEIALKILPKCGTKYKDFHREFQWSYFLSAHRNVLDTYNVAFETRSSYVFAQEFCPLGDLFESIPPQIGMTEYQAKMCARQIASALEFMHSKDLVHRDVKPENILVFDAQFNRIKLMDFGMTRRAGTSVKKMSGSIPYTPPEIVEAMKLECVHVNIGCDVWAFAVLLFCVLTGNFPWENADIRDVYYSEFINWQKRKSAKVPSQWRRFTTRMMRYFRKVLDPKSERRGSIKEIYKYVDEPWMVTTAHASGSEVEASPSASDNVDQLSHILREHGIDTAVNKSDTDQRISEWLLSV